MRRTLAVVMVMLGSLAVAKGDAPASQPSRGRMAVRVVRIDAPAEYIDAVRNVTPQLSPQASNLSNMLTSEGKPMLAFTVKRTLADNSEGFTISVDLDPWVMHSHNYADVDASDIADATVQDLRSKLADATENQRENWQNQLQSDTDSMGSLKAAREATSDRMAEFSSILGNAGGLADPSTEGVRDVARTLETGHEVAQLDIEGKTARQKALSEAIAKLTDQVREKLDADPIAQQLREVADAREKELNAEKALHSAGGATDADLNRDIAALAEAKAAVLERQEAAAKAAGADSLQQCNRDLLLNSVDLAELHARSDAMDKRLKVLSNALYQMEQLPSEESLKKSLDEVSGQLQNLELDLKSVTNNLAVKGRPKLRVVESRDEPAN